MLVVGKCYEKAMCVPGGGGGGPPSAAAGGLGGCLLGTLLCPILGVEAGTSCIGQCCVLGCCIGINSGKNLVTVKAGHVGVVLRFGKYHKVLPPGRHRLNMMADTVTEVATRVAVINVPKQSVLTKDNLSVEADAALYYRVNDAAQATFAVDNFLTALANLGMVTMRAVIGEFTLEYLFSKRLDLNERIKEVCSEQASGWGIEIDEITLLGVTLPAELEERMASVAQSKRDAEAAMIRASADKAVAKINSEAARIIKETPAALDIKWMDTLKTVASNPARTIIVPPTQANALTLLPGLK